MVSCSAIPIILAVKHTVLVQTHFHQVPIFQSGCIWCSGWRGPFGCWRNMQRRKKDRKLREKSGRNREKKMLGPRPVCIMKMCKKPIHSLFFFFFSVLKHSIHTNIFRQTHWIGIHQIGPQHMNDTNQWKCWWHLSVKILNVCSKINILT